jgi:predicted RNA binding protein YcfA (HicA-like mRNA interferase family)
VLVKVRDMLKKLRKDGWVIVRQHGSHRQFHHPTKRGTVTVAGKPSLDLDPKTEKSILKQAQLDENGDEAE